MCVLQSAYVDYLDFQHLFTVLLFSGNYFEKHPGNLSNGIPPVLNEKCLNQSFSDCAEI